MGSYPNDVGVLVPNVLLPPKGTDFEKWAVVACDQYTSQPEYWERVREIAGDEPTTLDLILPEAFLGQPDEAERIAAIREKHGGPTCAWACWKNSRRDLCSSAAPRRARPRNGLVMALDLEQYDYHKGSTTLIRATEGTIESRIPPRLRIREGAPLELPHILVLIDDPERTVIEPLVEQADRLPLLYDTDLMLGGGHVEGRARVGRRCDRGVLDALTALTDADAFHEKYGDHAPLLFAMGDGNHSFATAKANWEQIKAALPEPLRRTHPARYRARGGGKRPRRGHRVRAHPPRRVRRGRLPRRGAAAKAPGGAERRRGSADFEETDGPIGILARDAHVLPLLPAGAPGRVPRVRPVAAAAVGTLQNAIDAMLQEVEGATVDYIHGADVVETLARRDNAIASCCRPWKSRSCSRPSYTTARCRARPFPWARPTKSGTTWSAAALQNNPGGMPAILNRTGSNFHGNQDDQIRRQLHG